MADYVDGLTDAELRTKLAEFGFPVVPITATTRKVMSKKLKLLIENKNKVNSEGRRSLAKYSSEEESDTETKTKKNRRITVAGVMQPPVSSNKRKTTRISSRDEPVTSTPIPPASAAPVTSSVSSISTEVKTRRTTRIVKPVVEEDFETGSDSEPEIIEMVNNSEAPEADTSKISNSSYTSYGISSNLSPRVNLSRTIINDKPSTDYNSSTDYKSTDYKSDYSSPKPVPTGSSYTSRYTSYTSSTSDTNDSLDKLNQIRSRLSLGGNYEKSSYGNITDRKNFGSTGVGDGDASIETPFLSNFTRRLSQLSQSPLSKTEYNYKNDIIKEHDANGSSYNRLYLSRNKKRDYPQDFKSSQEKNIFKNNVVSLALLGLACSFFVIIFLMYMGIRPDHLPAVLDTSDYNLPVCVEKDYQSKPGINCVPQNEITDALNLFKVVLPELTKKALHFYCTDSSVMPFMTDNQIIDHVNNYYAPRDPYLIQKEINNLLVLIFKNPKWGISIIQKDSFPSDVRVMDNMDQILNHNVKDLAMIMLHPVIPWKCFIFNKLYTVLSSMFIVGLGFSIIFGIQKVYKYFLKQRKVRNDQIYSMVEKIIDILQSNVTENSDNFLAVNHVRDMIIPPQDRKCMASIWDGAVKFLQENESRVRTEVQIVSGEEFHVWRWLGNANLNMSGSPRSKIWQGQAFETQVGSVNSLPCSPTPCLKVRGFDERERNHFTIREAVLNKCASQCKILHCDVDSNSNCVYLKCANQNEAAIAYRNLHGWWYDGHLLTVKYLRLERYMQRFPDSPTKGPPYLQPSSNVSINNDWSNKDD